MQINLDKALLPLFTEISEVLEQNHTEGYLIGGYVRDLILNRAGKDIDIVVVGSGVAIAERIAERLSQNIKKKIQVVRFRNYGTAMFKYKGLELEFVGARKESYTESSRNPVCTEGTLRDDQLRRDFTINALGISLNKENFGELIDPFNGISDLESRIIRTPTEPDKTFSDDPLRMFRAIRFATQLNFRIADETFEGIKRNAHRISILSKERIVSELNKIMLSPRPSIGWKLFANTGMLKLFFPELEALRGVDRRGNLQHKDNFFHSIQVLDNLAATDTQNLYLRWAALLHDIGKARTKRFVEGEGWTFHNHEFVGMKMLYNIFKNLGLPLSATTLKYTQKIVALHMRPIVLAQEEITDSALRRLLFEAGDDLNDLMLLCDADITSKNEEKVRRYLANFQLVRRKLQELQEKDAIRLFQPCFTGEMIMQAFDLQPSPNVGILKRALKDAILDGIVENTNDASFQFLCEKAAQLGLKASPNFRIEASAPENSSEIL